MDYLYITKDAIEVLASERLYQSVEWDLGAMLVNVLNEKIDTWGDNKVLLHKGKKGIILYTNKINKKEGVLFDYTQISCFKEQDGAHSITIFQKIIKYAIKYFEKLALAPCEREIEGTSTTLIFPFPFSATKNVFKILVDRNGSKIDRQGMNILTVYASGENPENKKVTYTSLNKAISEINNITISKPKDSGVQVDSYQTTELTDVNISIDESLGYDNWKNYLSNTQKEFIYKPVNGVERLEGAAGTGKTLSMILRCIYILKNDPDKKIIFVTHSKATRDHIIQIFQNNWSEVSEKLCTEEDPLRPLLITTLQEWCIQFLGSNLPDTEYIDKDAQDSKIMQSLYIEQAYDVVLKKDFDTFKKICSPEFVDFIEKRDKEGFLELLQYEIATIIKGRADGDISKYKKIYRSQYLIPCKNENDRSFLFLIYDEYQKSLEKIGQYDSDDIILTALGQLVTPIWTRRRNKEGYNICFIDETHLFNINELSIFHYLNCIDSKNNIVYAIDKSQYVGERGILDNTMLEILQISDATSKDSKFDLVFRSSPDIINLAYNVLSSAACVFQHFENPLVSSSIVMSQKEEQKCFSPKYYLYNSDGDFIKAAFSEVDSCAKKFNISKSKILIATSTQSLFKETIKYAQNANKLYVEIKSRGDNASVRSAFSQNSYVIGDIDFIGGLEFDYVIIIGVDDQRVPPKSKSEAFHFINYAWHNRLYVAITRAKYGVFLMGNKVYGESPILESAVNLKLIEKNF